MAGGVEDRGTEPIPQSLDPWIELLGDTNGIGNGTVMYQVAANTTAAGRAGTIVINGQTHSVIQDAAPAMQIAVGADNALVLVLDTTAPPTFVLEASNDLLTWQPIWTNTLPAMLDLVAVDPASATQPMRFYRAVFK